MAMNDSVNDATPLDAVRTLHLPVSGDLRHYVSALVGIEATIVGSLPLSIKV